MIVTHSYLMQIVAQASSLSERLCVDLLKTNSAEAIEPQLNDNRLNRWCQVVSQGNWEKFYKRLDWDELNIIQAGSVVRSLPVVDSQALPAWADTLREIIQTTYSFANDLSFPRQSLGNEANLLIFINKEIKLPFAEVLLPAVSVARQKLLNRLDSPSLHVDCLPLEVLSNSAYLTLEISLLYKLLNICGKTLEYELSRDRTVGKNLLNLLNILRKSTPDKTQFKAEYEDFMEKILADGLLTFFQNYPVLARLMATAVDFWVETTAQFLQRLKADLWEIQQVFQVAPGSAGVSPAGAEEQTSIRIGENSHSAHKQFPSAHNYLGKAIDIKPSLSDPHNSGYTVIALTFESGLKLVYKPKGLGVEAAYTQFLTWCNQQGIPLQFKVLKVCDRQTYGWVEYVEHLPCEDEAAAQRFYQRSGMLLALLYALRVVDCHRENLIANGEHLVLIDMESIMHQEVNLMVDLAEQTEADTSVNLQFSDSVLRTGLLPHWEFTKNNRIAYDNSALGSFDPEPGKPIPSNVATLNGIPLSPDRYLDRIVTGFAQMYRFLIEKRKLLLAPDSPLEILQNQRVRFIFRATRIYGSILQKSLAPQFLRNGIDRSIELEVLARAFLVATQKPDAWPIFHAEVKAMEQLDIPYFAAYTNSKAITVGLDRPIEDYFKAPSYQDVVNLLQNLNETDLTQQIEIIKGSFYARLARKAVTENNPSINQAEYSQISPLTKTQLLQEATRIATEIQARAIWGADGSVKWISFAYIPDVERFQLMPLPEDFYNGNGGIALFLSALDYVRQTSQFRDLALGALLSIRKFLQTADFESTRRFVRRGIGGATGLASIIYTLVMTSRFLKEPTLVEDALGIANLITPEIIASDKQFDIIGGAAGAILGLLALHSETKDSGVLDKAIICGQHLLAHRTSVNGKPKAWKILGQKQYTGFSHGTAGIAYALLRLYAVTQDPAYLDAAREGIAYENSVFSAVAANWPDLRAFAQQNGEPGFMVSWCHGATGIGLARLGGLSILKTDEIDGDVQVSLQTTQKHTLQDVDCLCCGNFGRIEMLLFAAETLSRPELLAVAEKRAAWAVRRAEQAGGYLFPKLPNSVFTPSFFQGTSGIGYQLLRLAYPEVLPCVLLCNC
ncbi:type 2 lanthipeptide synthetase LanM family protein [Aerosakkonema funiforme]|uniref:type 2 lanthipeptide synthetase LanM family protein n=1 Tax=Aerosakkonema funiforme TaxID=1246630 RepID=UPI0035BB2C20